MRKGFSRAAGAALGAAMMVLGAGAAQAGQGYYVTVENALDKEVNITVRSSAQWYLYNFWNAPPLQPKETRTFYTESCRPFFSVCADYQRNKGMHNIDLIFTTLFNRDFYNVDITDGYPPRVQCSAWKGNDTISLKPVKQGDQYVFTVKLAPHKSECTSK